MIAFLVLLIAGPTAVGALAYAASPVARSGMNGAARSYWTGYQTAIQADRTKRRAVRSKARAVRIKNWKSKESGWSGTAKWQAWQAASWAGTIARSQGKAVRAGLKNTRTGWTEGVARARATKQAQLTPTDTVADLLEPPAGPAPETQDWHNITPKAVTAPNEGPPMTQQAEFTTAQEIHTAATDMAERFNALLEELMSTLAAIGEGTIKSKSIIQGVSAAQEGLLAMESVQAGITSITEGAQNLMLIGESMAAEEIDSDVTVGALVS